MLIAWITEMVKLVSDWLFIELWYWKCLAGHLTRHWHVGKAAVHRHRQSYRLKTHENYKYKPKKITSEVIDRLTNISATFRTKKLFGNCQSFFDSTNIYFVKIYVPSPQLTYHTLPTPMSWTSFSRSVWSFTLCGIRWISICDSVKIFHDIAAIAYSGDTTRVHGPIS